MNKLKAKYMAHKTYVSAIVNPAIEQKTILSAKRVPGDGHELGGSDI